MGLDGVWHIFFLFLGGPLWSLWLHKKIWALMALDGVLAHFFIFGGHGDQWHLWRTIWPLGPCGAGWRFGAFLIFLGGALGPDDIYGVLYGHFKKFGPLWGLMSFWRIFLNFGAMGPNDIYGVLYGHFKKIGPFWGLMAFWCIFYFGGPWGPMPFLAYFMAT